MSSSKESLAEPLTLAACLRGGRLLHAYLLEGGGEQTLCFAKNLARAALCAEETPPCGACRDCVKVKKEIHPDVLVYGGDGGARSFHIDVVREIRGEAYIKPNEARGKVLILQNVQNMSIQAQNALLKIIEEPPANVTFILTCDNKAAMLETVLSRVAAFNVQAAPPKSEYAEKARDLLVSLCCGSELAAMASLVPFERDRSGFVQLLAELRIVAAQALIARTKDAAHEIVPGKRISRLQLLKIIAIIDEVNAAALQNVGGALLITALSAKLK